MISPAWCVLMARYNIWQNRSIYGAADGLDEAAREADRGAFFGSIRGTLSHLLWGDLAWMSRFEGVAPPEPGRPRLPDASPCGRRARSSDRLRPATPDRAAHRWTSS